MELDLLKSVIYSFNSKFQNEQYYPINTTYMSTFSFSSYESEEVLLDETTTIDQQELIVYNDITIL